MKDSGRFYRKNQKDVKFTEPLFDSKLATLANITLKIESTNANKRTAQHEMQYKLK